MAYTVLIADDEKEIRELLRLYLEKDGYQVVEAEDGIQAVKLLEKKEIDLALLDIMMPGMDGYQVLKRIRENSNIPVMILSAKNQDVDKILGLDLGADDYLSKPFNPLEAMARINSNIRRFYSLGAKGKEIKELKVKDLRLDTEACAVYKNDTLIDLTSVEYRIMRMFMENPGKVFTKQQLFEEGWGEEYIVADNSIMVCISKLRAKLSEENDAYIKTIRGLGYRMEKE
ncbi:response regulator transcription factor [Roseburia sp. 499]|uniref:response regulator transcription factor n=1 Tax=Roseburia sp. 499 TaxID=1261634 RepID=UPI000950C985|nr:response regulator transcription factor [Roseburia sp. 499]WVK68474.1 response regulator transcription factor [Roseburia sp. 499]